MFCMPTLTPGGIPLGMPLTERSRLRRRKQILPNSGCCGEQPMVHVMADVYEITAPPRRESNEVGVDLLYGLMQNEPKASRPPGEAPESFESWHLWSGIQIQRLLPVGSTAACRHMQRTTCGE
jgi:hypothetical protein